MLFSALSQVDTSLSNPNEQKLAIIHFHMMRSSYMDKREYSKSCLSYLWFYVFEKTY